jgi:hypothetical protein
MNIPRRESRQNPAETAVLCDAAMNIRNVDINNRLKI